MSKKSVEPMIADVANGWLKKYNLDYKLEQESLNTDIDNALLKHCSKSGRGGGNRPDVKLLLQDKYNNYYPIVIEYKGYKDKLIKLDSNGIVENRNSKNELHTTNIQSYAVNGAVHYATAILNYTSYGNVIAIGVTGYKNDYGELQSNIAVYNVSKNNFGMGQEVGKYSDLSFLSEEHFDKFIEKVQDLKLSPADIEKRKIIKEAEIDKSFIKLNNDIYKNEKGLSENDRVYLVVASIIATLGVPGKVRPLEKEELKSSNEIGNTDGEIILRKIEAYFNEKKIPEDKKNTIIRTLQNTLTSSNSNTADSKGESQIKRVFCQIVEDLGIYYKMGLTIDFTGKLFNEMYNWLGFTQDKLNDVVLTPSYVATLLARLTKVNKDSYVWDFATGSAGLLVAAMNEMLTDAKEKITSPEELKQKETHIKAKQLLGLEVLPNIYMLAILNMILMGDGSSNIINKDSLENFNGKYHFTDKDEKFPATSFILNPPYSQAGCGMIFVEKALNMMKSGYAAIIIQNSAGSGKATEYNKRILEKNTLLASIKMPIDLFRGKSSIQTYIYVFKIGEGHQEDNIVKFIDFSNDGYSRTNRKKASNNLKNTDNAIERYQEIVDLVHLGKHKLHYLTEQEYFEGFIDPKKGNDWNQSAPIDIKPTVDDFKKTVSDYLAWEVSQIFKKKDCPSSINSMFVNKYNYAEWQEFELEKLFESFNGDVDIKKEHINGSGEYVITSGLGENGILGKTDLNAKIFDENTITVDMFGNVFYRNFKYKMVTHARVFSLKPLFRITQKQGLFIASSLHFLKYKFGYDNMCSWAKIKNKKIFLPAINGDIDFNFMEERIKELEEERIKELDAYLIATGLKNYNLTDKEIKFLKNYEKMNDGGGDLINILFSVNSSKKRFDANKVTIGKTGYPYIVRTANDNGVKGYIKENSKYLNKGNTISFGQDTATIFYQENPYFTGDKIKILQCKDKYFNKVNAMFFITSMIKAFSKFSWGNQSFSKDIIENQTIYFPVTNNNKIDYDFMETFIRAIQKLVIKDVVLYADNKIKLTKQVVADKI